MGSVAKRACNIRRESNHPVSGHWATIGHHPCERRQVPAIGRSARRPDRVCPCKPRRDGVGWLCQVCLDQRPHRARAAHLDWWAEAVLASWEGNLPKGSAPAIEPSDRPLRLKMSAWPRVQLLGISYSRWAAHIGFQQGEGSRASRLPGGQQE